MKLMARPLLAGLALATLTGAALAQVTPATRPCLVGEEMIGGVCVPLSRPGYDPAGGIDVTRGADPSDSVDTTGSIGASPSGRTGGADRSNSGSTSE